MLELGPLQSDRYPNPVTKKKIFYFSIFFFIFLTDLILADRAHKNVGLIGNFKSFKKMSLHPTDIQTRQRKKINFLFFRIFLYFFLNDLILPDRAHKNMGLIGDFKTFKKMILHPTDIQTRQRKKKFRFFHILLFFYPT